MFLETQGQQSNSRKMREFMTYRRARQYPAGRRALIGDQRPGSNSCRGSKAGITPTAWPSRRSPEGSHGSRLCRGRSAAACPARGSRSSHDHTMHGLPLQTWALTLPPAYRCASSRASTRFPEVAQADWPAHTATPASPIAASAARARPLPSRAGSSVSK